MQIIDLINIVMLLFALAICGIIVILHGLRLKSMFSIVAVVVLALTIGIYINEQAKPNFADLYSEVTGCKMPMNSSVIYGKESDADFHGDYDACALVAIHRDSLIELIEDVNSKNIVDTTGFNAISLSLIEEPMQRKLDPIKTMNIIDSVRSYIRSIQILTPDTIIVCRSSS